MTEQVSMEVSRRVPNGLAGDQTAWKIYEILRTEAVGQDNAITIESLSCRIFPDNPSKTDTRIRSACGRLLFKFQIPVVSCSHGKYVATKPKDLDQYNEDLEKRVIGMQRKRIALDTIKRSWDFEKNGMFPAPTKEKQNSTEHHADAIPYAQAANKQPGLFGPDPEAKRTRGF